MNQSLHTGTVSARLPFFGLGFDMDAVLAKAASTTLEPATPSSRRSFGPVAYPSAVYMLQLRSGRTTRAP